MRKKSMYDEVRAALKKLCKESPNPGDILFTIYFSAERVAEEAGCSQTTARKHLERCIGYRGYRRSRIHGVYGYRFDEEYA